MYVVRYDAERLHKQKKNDEASILYLIDKR